MNQIKISIKYAFNYQIKILLISKIETQINITKYKYEIREKNNLKR